MPPSLAIPLNGPPIAGKFIKRLLISAGQYRGSGIMVPSSGSERLYLEKGTLAMPSMLGPRCEEGPLYQLYRAGELPNRHHFLFCVLLLVFSVG
jgi:hypothetical protein